VLAAVVNAKVLFSTSWSIFLDQIRVAEIRKVPKFDLKKYEGEYYSQRIL